MNKKRTLIMAALVLLAAGRMSADNKLVVADSSTEQDVAEARLSEVSKLSFTGGKLVITLANETTKEVALTTGTVIRLEGDATALGNVASNATEISYSGDQLSATGLTAPVAAALYAMSGQQLLSVASWDGSPISTASLERGVYIFKINNQSLKFVKR